MAEMHQFLFSLENSTYDPFKYKMGNSILILLVCMGKSTKIKRVSTPMQRLLQAFSFWNY